MQIHELKQGSQEWHAYRASHRNASDAPAMLGCSSYKTRSQLLREMTAGIAPEIDGATQRLFDDGHRFEALARPVGETIIGEDLYPVVGSEGIYSASFDGLTMDESTAFEHKTLNDELRAAFDDMETIAPEHRERCAGKSLPKMYQVQMEQQCMVSGCERVLFMASKWKDDSLVEERHCWYYPDSALRAELVAGWTQFDRDLTEYTPPATAALVVAAPTQALPAVAVTVAGAITVKENFAAFKVALDDFLENRLIRKPQSDQDFADLDLQIKAMKNAETALDSAEAQMLAQIETVDHAKKTKDMLIKLVRDNRLMAEKLLASEKERRRAEIVAKGVEALQAHIAALNQRLGKPYMPTIQAHFAAAIKGLRSLASMEDAVATTLANAKIEADTIADRIQANLTTLRELAAEHAFLFVDTAQIVLKSTDDCTALIKLRIAEHKAAEEKRLADERARIAEEERVKAEAKARAEQEAIAAGQRQQAMLEAAQQRREEEASAKPTAPAMPLPELLHAVAPKEIANAMAPAVTGARIRLGEINARIAPISISAEGLAQLGYPHVETDKSAKLYRLSDFPAICAAIARHVTAIAQDLAQAA